LNHRPPKSAGEAADANIQLAAQLQSDRIKLCGQPAAEEPLSRALALASR
jgi:hypothetical protein